MSSIPTKSWYGLTPRKRHTKKSLELGKRCDVTYSNERGKKVSIRFRGLHELQVIHEDLAHGSELSYRNWHQRKKDQELDLVQKKTERLFSDPGTKRAGLRGRRDCKRDTQAAFSLEAKDETGA